MDQLPRREIFRILGGGLAAEVLLKGAPKSYTPRFLSPSEYQIVDILCALLLPADEDSPGASEAGVPWFLDTILLYATQDQQQTWRNGIASIDQLARNRFGKAVVQCTNEQRTAIMSVLTENEGHPQTPPQHFFAEFKPLVIEGYCLSDVGMRQYLHYRGNTELSEFPGCRPGKIES